MTMIDEHALRGALRSAADAIAVSDNAVEDILAAARDADVPAGALGSGGPKSRRPRRVLVATMAATAALAVSVIAVTTLGGAPSSTLGSSRVPSTTAPQRLAAQGAFGAGVAGGSTASGPVHAASGTAPTPDAALPAAPSQAVPPPVPTGAVGQSSKVEETGSMDLGVGKGQLESVLARLTNLATANGGFVAGTQTQSGAGSLHSPSYGSITLQVPQASFGTVVAEAQVLGKVTALTTKGTDVTGQYVDLQARISALQASRDQYITIMSKASSISDILAVQNQLDTLQAQIEELQGQLQVLDSQTTFSTLAVSLSEPGGAPAPAPRPPSGIADAWHGAVSGFTTAFDGLVRAAGPALFVLLFLGALAVLGRWTWRGVRRRTL